MYIPHRYVVALLMMLFSMLCWGSWANTQKIDKGVAIRVVLLGLHVGDCGLRPSVRSEPGPDESSGSGKFLSQSRQRQRSVPGGSVRRRNDFQSRKPAFGSRHFGRRHGGRFSVGRRLGPGNRCGSQLLHLACRQSVAALWRDSAGLRGYRRQCHGLSRTVERRKGRRRKGLS